MAKVQDPKVLVGEDGWLFWRGARDRVLKLHTPTRLAAWIVWRWTRLLRRRAGRCEALGARFIQLIAPDKLSIYPDKLGGQRTVDGPAVRLARGAPGVVLDLVEPLRRARRDGETVLKTDSHWTHWGYVVAYRALCEALDASVADTVLAAAAAEATPWLFDLGSKLEPQVREPYAIHDFSRRAVRREANALMRHREGLMLEGFAPGLMVGCRFVMENAWEGADPRRVVVFGDSYAFHQTGLVPMLAESFREVHFLWSAALDWGYLARVRPDVVIAETAERFTIRPPRDGVDIDAVAEKRVRAAREAPQPSPTASTAAA